MMNTYTTNASEIIRQDFLRFSAGGPRERTRQHVALDADLSPAATPFRGSLDDLRAEMTDDNGQGSFASYKSPLF